MLKKLRRLSSLWWLLPFLTIVGLFVVFLTARIPGFPEGLEARGQFGDSFGVLNSLFTGLGFAGLLVTVGLQQRQLRQQAKEFQSQLRDVAVRRYEDNLFRLLALYQEAVSSVISTRNGQTTRGRDVLRHAAEAVLKLIRQDGVNSIPHDIQTRQTEQTLTEKDREVLDFLYFRNFWHLNYGLVRQGRLLESLKALLVHLEYGAPAGTDLSTYRNIVLSQITHIEVSYFILIALGFGTEGELRELMKRSGMLKRASNVSLLKVHRLMYLEYWGYDMRADRDAHPLPIGHSRVKALRK